MTNEPLSRRRFLLQSAAVAAGGVAATTTGLALPAGATDGPDIHGGAIPLPMAPGPVTPTWESIGQHYATPKWFGAGRFGIFIHWGLYAVPAYHNEWYARHMYGAFVKWHTEHYGPPDKFGYKDFIPLFKAEKYDPDAWASLFRESGARYVVPCAEHHDGFAMYDSALTKWCAGKMGPKRDLIGDLAKSVRKEGLIFGLSSHRMEHHSFMYPTANVPSDILDPRYADFYGPPVPGHMDDGNASPAFQADWLARCQELIDKYRPQMFWFDAGVDDSAYDAVKRNMTAYYLNRADGWRKEVTVSAKGGWPAGSVLDFEKSGRGPKTIRQDVAWQIDDQIATNSWGYINDIKYRSAVSILAELIDSASKGGNLLLNISPRADGTIPDEQQQILRAVGKWLGVNGEAIYETQPWTRFADAAPAEGGGRPTNYRFTAQKDSVYAVALSWPGTRQATIPALGSGAAGFKARSVRLLGAGGGDLKFTQDADALRVDLPASPLGDFAYVFKVTKLS